MRRSDAVLFDTHCHLDTDKFDTDRDAVFERAYAAGVMRFLNPAYDLESSRRAAALSVARTDLVSAVGVHPNSAAEWGAEVRAALRQIALDALGRVVAIGEIGLDYHWNVAEPAKQKVVFIEQLALAAELDLPVIIHCREAYDDTLDILEVEWRDRPLVLHSFAGDLQQMQRALDCGFHIGISGPVTYPNAAGTRAVARAVPADRLVIETDSPYLSPQKYRGKRNEPAFVRLVALKIAEVREEMLSDLALYTTRNAMELFRLG
ncbi:MAG: TatD family hydrolase [Chloroflexi bacterium]|nr:TatD family hydrolase [Chloroflexota bacterium]